MKHILLSCLIYFFALFYAPLNAATNQPVDYSEVDAYAQNAPEFKDMPDLVKYLIKPYQHNELLKARALFIWIASHVQYDMYKYKNIDKKNNHQNAYIKNDNVYQTRLGVCGDFAALFNQMARRAHLNAEIITGAAGYNLTPKTALQSPHAWNAVKINNKWHLVDVTWALGGQYATAQDIRRPKEYKKLLKSRKKDKTKESFGIEEDRPIDDYWFLPPPEEAIKTHFPQEIKWQLLKHPVTPHKIWRANEKSQREKSKTTN